MLSEQRAATCNLEDARSGGAGWVPCLRAGAHAQRMQQSSRLVATQSGSPLGPPSVGAEVRGVYRTYQAARTYPGNGE
jgi:hypothetical protein